jgi:hypothetical protein
MTNQLTDLVVLGQKNNEFGTAHNKVFMPFYRHMIKENSGKIFRFKLDHGLGFGFAEVYDFTDESIFDGCIAFVFNVHDKVDQKQYSETDIRSGGIALGPIRLHKYPNTRGLHSWKFLFQTTDFFIDSLPVSKELRGLMKDDNWDNLGDWYRSDYQKDKLVESFVRYEEVRHLETRILNPPIGVVTKFTMKFLVDSGENVSDYYDLNDLGTKNMFVQMINTYYPLNQTKTLLGQMLKLDK